MNIDPTSVPFFIAAFGFFLLLVSIVGGGIGFRGLDIPPLGTAPRITLGLLGVVFIFISLIKQDWLSGMAASLLYPVPKGRTVWVVDHSYVYLEATGNRRQFIFVRPNTEFSRQGAYRGRLLFDGKKDGDTFEGTLFAFAGRCDPRGYKASGPVTKNDTVVTLIGTPPKLDPETCGEIGDEDEQRLSFYYKYKS